MASSERVLLDGRTVLACMCAILYWEYINSLGKEYRLIWRGAEWSAVKVSFFINRYTAIIAMTIYLAYMFIDMPHSVCEKIHWLPLMFSVTSLAFVEVILFLRVYAIWRKQTWVAVLFMTLLVGIVGFTIWTSAHNYAQIMPEGELGCISLNGPDSAPYAWVPWLCCSLYDALALAFTLVEVFRVKTEGVESSPLVMLLVRDGVYYFMVVFTVKLAATLNFRYNKSNPSLLVPVAAVMASIMCSRLLFHMKEVKLGNERLSFGGSTSRPTFTVSHAKAAEIRSRTLASASKGKYQLDSFSEKYVHEPERLPDDRLYDAELNRILDKSYVNRIAVAVEISQSEDFASSSWRDHTLDV